MCKDSEGSFYTREEYDAIDVARRCTLDVNENLKGLKKEALIKMLISMNDQLSNLFTIIDKKKTPQYLTRDSLEEILADRSDTLSARIAKMIENLGLPTMPLSTFLIKLSRI